MKGTIRGVEYFDTHSVRRDIKSKALRSSSAMVFSSAASTLLQLAGTVVLARLLTPQDFGLVAMVTACSLLLSNVGYNGFIEAIIHAEEIGHQQVNALFWLGLGISLGLAVLFSAFSPLLANFYHEPRVVSIAIVFSVGFAFYALATEHMALIMRRMEFRKVVFNNISAIIISTIIGIAMALKGFGYWALVARQLAVPIAAAVIVWIQCPWRPGWPKRASKMGHLIKYAANTFGNFGLDYVGRNLDKALLGWRWGSQELGNYDRAYRLFVMPVEQTVTPLAGVALATLSRLRDDPEKFRRYYLRSLSIIGLLGMLISAILTVAGQDIIIFLLGAQWTKAGQIFTAFGPSIGIILIYRTNSWLHLSLGTPGRWLRWSLTAMAVTALMFVIGLRFRGLGIAIAYGFSYYFLTGPALWYAGRPMGIRLKDIWQQLWRYYVAALMSGSVVWLALYKAKILGTPTGDLNMLLRILATSFSCGILFLLAVLVLHWSTQPIRDLLMVIGEAIPIRKQRSRHITSR